MQGKPIPGSAPAQMTMEIHWANEKHADPESVFGSLADALFENDKHVAGSFTFVHAEDKKGKVEVMITI
ncbi:MAG TPA: hypothetical protein VNH18_22330 [Bryobacteraceae bacterium]|nr:hypothetical protein [Bryobacteraceae bacterium]